MYFADFRGWVWRLPDAMKNEFVAPTLADGASLSE